MPRCPANPLLRRKRAVIVTWGSGGGLLIVIATWALRPLEPIALPAIELHHAAATESEKSQDLAELDGALFEVALWNPPKPPEPPQDIAKPAMERVMALRLVGIVREGGQYKAALFDTESGEVTIVGNGQRVGQYIVARIDQAVVELRDQEDSIRLYLREEAS